MNLHGLVSGAIGVVNPFISCDYYASNGFTIEDSGRQVPAYLAPVTGTAQVQPSTADDLKQLDAVNLGGVKKTIFLYGAAFAVVRKYVKGGDKLVLAVGSNAGTYLVNLVPEQWDDGPNAAWVKVIATLQND